MQSMLSLMVKEFWKSVNICQSYGQESKWVSFSEHSVVRLSAFVQIYAKEWYSFYFELSFNYIRMDKMRVIMFYFVYTDDCVNLMEKGSQIGAADCNVTVPC